MRLGPSFALVALLLTGCATPYTSGKSSLTGGFYDDRLEHNKYEVTFAANGYTSSERATDLAIMRACELALLDGYNYVIMFDADASMNEDTVYTGYGATSSLKPVTQLIAVGVLREPTQFSSYYPAAETFEKLAIKNEIKANDGSVRVPESGEYTSHPEVISFESRVDGTLPPGNDVDIKVFRGRTELERTGFPLARFTYIENPTLDLEEFVSAARNQVAELGGNAIVIEDRAEVLHARLNGYEEEFPDSVGFVADAYYFPAGDLGVIWDPADLVLGKYVVRKAPITDTDDGLLIGDRVIEVDGIDIGNSAELAMASVGWQPGDSVTVLLIRNGREQTLNTKLLPGSVE